MNIKAFIKDHLVSIFLYLFTILFIFLFLLLYKASLSFSIMITFLLACIGLGIFFYEYYRRKSFYQKLITHLEEMDQKYLITAMLTKPSFLEGQIFYDTLYACNKSMNEKIFTYQQNLQNFKEYIELWIHEIKIPLCSGLLALHNHKEKMPNVAESFYKIENYIEQVLYYTRSETTEKDYLISKTSLQSLISKAIMGHKEALLYHQVQLEIAETKAEVYTDAKWLIFMIGQIIGNALQYKKEEESLLKIYTRENKSHVTLYIYDNGVGIAKEDLPRVFEKSFTGKNGHKRSASTGMGLYICKNLCDKLGHQIAIDSEEGVYTLVKITFSKNLYYEEVME